MVDVRTIRHRCQPMIGGAGLCQAVGHQFGTSGETSRLFDDRLTIPAGWVVWVV